jgi:hypothetical protein
VPAGLKFRSQPDLNDATWIDRVVFAQGTQLIALGEPTPPGAGSYRWQHVRAPDGRTGWVAYGLGRQAYLGEQPPVRIITTIAPSGIRFRQQPSTSAEWIDRIVFMPGTRLSAIGQPSAPDGQAIRWQQVRTSDGRQGWIAYSQDNQLYVRE